MHHEESSGHSTGSATDRIHFIRAGILVLISTIIVYLALDRALPMPEQASTQATIIDNLISQHMMLLAFLFSLIVVFMLYAIVMFRKKEGDESEGEHFHGNTALEIGWTVSPLIFVVLFAFLGVWTLNQVEAEQPNEVVVTANGFQWSWSFEYEEGFVDGALVLPVNQPALIQLTSADVLHAFWVPEFRVKKDLVPGQQTEVRFTPTIAGEYKLRCAELCGLTHWNMLADVKVLEQDEYDAWLADKVAQITPELASND